MTSWRPTSRHGRAPERIEAKGGPLLLDTHVWIWYLDGAADRLPSSVVDRLRSVAGSAGLLVSDISVWEAGTKAARGRLRLMPSPGAWIERASRQPGLSFIALDRQILLGSTQLPGDPHGDPADRMLIATAALSGIPLVHGRRRDPRVRQAGGGLRRPRRAGVDSRRLGAVAGGAVR